jgi:hypothetical protein
MKRFLVFAVLAFGPLPLLWTPVSALVAAPALSILAGPTPLPGLAMLLPVVLLPLLVALFCYLTSSRVRSWLWRALVVYAGWFVLVAAACMLIVLAVGSASMAVNDGGVQLDPEQLSAAASALLVRAHYVLVPWVLFASSLLHVLSTEWQQPQHSAAA